MKVCASAISEFERRVNGVYVRLVLTTALCITVKIKKGKNGRFMEKITKREHDGRGDENTRETREKQES